ncbi:type VI secretion system protein ImpH [Pseudomonas sp. TE3610]
MSVQAVLAAIRPRVAQASVYRFCHLLEQAEPQRALLGSTDNPADDPVRFRPHPGMGFPGAELKAVEHDALHPEQPPTVRTWLLGLYGVESPLPTAYLDDIALQREGHQGLQAFLDIFNHRIFTQFYRVWRKYSYPVTFAPGGTDATSQCLLGLIGLGLSGTAAHVDAPVSRFLALLGPMRLPTRTGEGLVALVRLLAANTLAQVTPHWPVRVPAPHHARLGGDHPVCLAQSAPLGDMGRDASCEVLLSLATDDPQQAQGWLPGAPLHRDLLVLLRVYLGWRCTVRLTLTLAPHLLPTPILGKANLLLGRTGLIGTRADTTITIHLGRYQGLHPNPFLREIFHVRYRIQGHVDGGHQSGAGWVWPESRHE